MTARSTHKVMVHVLRRLREDAGALTTENGNYPSKATLRMRDAVNVAISESAAAMREHEEQHDATKTPVRPPSQANLAAVRGIGERVGQIFEEERNKP